MANPALFLGIPADEPATVEQVRLRTGPALLVEDCGDKGNLERVTVIRSTGERIYCVLANTRQRALVVAGAIP